jgi:hypothetical protein
MSGCNRPLGSPILCGVSKGVEDGCRPPALQASHPMNGCKAISGVARLQGIEGSGKADPGETLRSPWIPFAIWDCRGVTI